MKAALRLIRPNMIAAVVMLGLSITVLVVAQSFGRSSGMFPRFIGWIFVVLCSLELLVQLKKTFIDNIAFEVNVPELLKEIKAVSWLVILLIMLFLLGFMITVPAFIFLFLRLHAHQPLLRCAAIAGGGIGFVYLIFVLLLEYTLYPGLIFGG